MNVLFLFFTDPPRAFSSSVAALAAVVRAAGHAPAALEVPRRASIADIAREVAHRAPDVLAVSAMTRDWPGAAALLASVRTARSRPYVVVGGYHASLAPADVAACAAVDAVCIGEGERPLAALLAQLAAHGPPVGSSPGLWVRGPAGFAPHDAPPPDAAPEPDIAALPWWDYDVFGDVRAVLAGGVNTFGPHVDRYLPTRASRGCPFTCAYCSAPAWGRINGLAAKSARNTRPVAALCAELAALRERYAPEGFEFWDEHFPVNVEWLREFAEEYPRRVGLPFKVEMHPGAASRERLELLARAGCAMFHCGVEAGDPDLRRSVLNRRTPDEELARVFDDCRALGLATSASLMTALPGETRAQGRATVDLLHRLRPGSFMWSTYQPLPGTPLGDAAVARWPPPAGARFDDYPRVESRMPPRASAAEQAETFAELAQLQAELVAAATPVGAQGARARPVDIPSPQRPASTELARLLGLAPPGSALTRGVRVNTARVEPGCLTVEIEAADLSPWQVVFAPRADAAAGPRAYRSTPRMDISYRGRDAPTALLRALDAIAARVAPLAFDDLQRACATEFLR